MAIGKRINPFSKNNNDTGFGVNANSYGGRFVNKDGTYNLHKEGLSFWKRFSIYYTMLNLSRWKFIGVILLFYFLINLIFCGLYMLIGMHEFQGVIAQTDWQRFKEVYFFSTETFTTVGYGRVNPVGDYANLVASIEAMSGFLSFALATGLIYGRFARPKAFLAFSEHALVSPYKGDRALMFRLATFKNHHHLTNAEVKVNLGITVQEDGVAVFRFYDLALERQRVDSLTMNWTIVHPIDDVSPLQGLTAEDLQAADAELYVIVRGFDDVYSNTVLQRTSYTYEEIVFDARFTSMYRESADGKTTILELDKLNRYERVVMEKKLATD